MVDLTNKGPLGLNKFNAVEMATKIASGESTSEAIVSDCLERIKVRDPDIGAWKYIDPAYALEQARTLDKIPNKGMLHGVPIGIKDNFDTVDMPTEYGTTIYPGFRPKKDTLTVATLRAAGAVILGKTVTSEFAGPYPGPTLNPHDTNRSPGVSSMGSAAGVADYMVPLANGTQTGGSVIRPAALCGVYGYKGSFNHLDGSGIKHLKPSIDTLGHFARSIDDLELMRCVLTGSKFKTLGSENKIKPRIGICKTDQWHAAKPETVKMIDACLLALADCGAKVTDIELPTPFTKVMEKAFDDIRLWELFIAHEEEIKHHLHEFSPWLQDVVKHAEQYTDQTYTEALEEAEGARSILRVIFESVDVLITPGALGEAPTNLKGMPVNNFNNLWTLMYVPCVNLPAFTGPNNLPVGLQVVGPQDKDRRTLEMAHWMDQTITEHFGAHPVPLYG